MKHSIMTHDFYRNAASIAGIVFCVGCASAPATPQQYAAFGYMSPGPNGNAEVIGVFETRTDCDAAAEGWMSRQVAGNPVYAECAEWDGVDPPRTDASGLLIVPG